MARETQEASVLSPADSQTPLQFVLIWPVPEHSKHAPTSQKLVGTFPRAAWLLLFQLLSHCKKAEYFTLSARVRNASEMQNQLILNIIFNYGNVIIYFVLWTPYQGDPFLVALIKFCWHNVTFQTSLSAHCVAIYITSSLWIFISLELQAVCFL